MRVAPGFLKKLNEKPEYKEMSFKGNRPDAMILRPDRKKIAFELELQAKSKHRYELKHRSDPDRYSEEYKSWQALASSPV